MFRVCSFRVKIVMDYSIVSAMPGRIRIQFQDRRARPAFLESVAKRLADAPIIEAARIVVDARSIVVTFDRRRRMTDVALRIAQIAGPGSKKAREEKKKPRLLAILHSIPGRLAVRIPHLVSNPHIGDDLKSKLASHHGISKVVTEVKNGSVTLFYNPKVHRPAKIFRLLGDMVHMVAQSPEGHQEVERAKDISETQKAELNPLLIPTAAVITSAIAGVPVGVAFAVTAIAALPVAGRAIGSLLQRKATVDQLDFGAVVVLMGLGDYFTAGLMTWLIGLGDFIRSRTMRKSRRAISEMLSPAGQKAWVEKNGEIVSLPVASLVKGDIVVVHPGELLPVDGTVIAGRAVLDCKILTGESVPILRESGDPVFALTTLVDGTVSIRVEHIGRETRAGQVATLVEDAPLSDTRVQNYAAMLGDRLVIPIFGLAALTYALTLDPLRFAGILILDFATGIRVSAPTTILSSMICASRQGLFIKGGKAMEKLAGVNAVVFDKTGTLTMGEPAVTEVVSCDSRYTSQEVLRLAACAEAKLKHPAAAAIVRAAEAAGLRVTPPQSMEYVIGHGVNARVDDVDIQVGSRRYMTQLGVDLSEAETFVTDRTAAANSLVYISCGAGGKGGLLGVLAYTDPPRDESAAVILALRQRGIKRIVMLTGDSRATAHAVAGKLAITDIIAEAYPEQKAEVVESLRREGYSVAVIGDGVNDSPAFTRADVGISLAAGADVAKETADVILLDNSLWGLPRSIDLARSAMGILKQNINLIVIPTIFGITGAVLGLTTPLISTIINNGTTVLAGLNALRPLAHVHPIGTKTVHTVDITPRQRRKDQKLLAMSKANDRASRAAAVQPRS